MDRLKEAETNKITFDKMHVGMLGLQRWAWNHSRLMTQALRKLADYIPDDEDKIVLEDIMEEMDAYEKVYLNDLEIDIRRVDDEELSDTEDKVSEKV